MDRTYFLAKAGSWMNSMPQEFINYGGSLGWLACSLAAENFILFEDVYSTSTLSSRYYLLNELVASKGFRSFGEVRETIKLLSTDLGDGKVLQNTATGDAEVDDDFELKTSFTNETLSWDSENQELVVTPAETYTPEKVAIAFDTQRHDAAVLAMKAVAKAVIEEEFDKRFRKLDLSCTIEEATFPYQYEDAVAYKADPSGEYPFLSALAEARDLTVDEIATKIITARDQHKVRATKLLTDMNKVKQAYKVLTTTADMNRFYEDYLGIQMPFIQAIEEGRIVLKEDGSEIRTVEVKTGLQF